MSLLYSCAALAKPEYQIDLILFAQQPTLSIDTHSLDAPFVPISANALTLKSSLEKIIRPFYLLPSSYSNLKDQYYLLSRRSSYPVLGHYSWRQPATNQKTVALPLTEHNGWQMQGTLKITQSNYYTFNAEIQASPPNNPQSAFTVIQKHRLQGDTIYYLDNDHLGMLVSIHSLDKGKTG